MTYFYRVGEGMAPLTPRGSATRGGGIKGAGGGRDLCPFSI